MPPKKSKLKILRAGIPPVSDSKEVAKSEENEKPSGIRLKAPSRTRFVNFKKYPNE